MGLLDFLIPVAIGAGAFALAYVNPIITVVVAGLILLFANPLFSVIDYRLSEAEFEVTAFGRIRLRHVPYQEILQVRRVGWSELFKPEVRWAESLGSNILRPLILVRRRGRRRPMIITPADPDAFVAALAARLRPDGDLHGPPAGSATRQGRS